MSIVDKIIDSFAKKLGTGLYSAFSKYFRNSRIIHSFWKLSNENARLHSYITNTDYVMKNEFNAPLFNREDAIAQGLAVAEFERLFSFKKTADYSVAPKHFKQNDTGVMDDLILLGGPVYNSISGAILTDTACSYRNIYFDSAANRDLHFKDDDGAPQVLQPVNNGRGYFTDYGIIVNVGNPWSKGHRVIGLMGCNGLGTYAAAKYLHSGKYRETMSKVKKADEYVIIVKCKGLWENEHLQVMPESIVLERVLKLK